MVKVRLMQGSVFVWFMLILAVFVFGFAFVMLTNPVSTIYNMQYNNTYLYDDTYQTFLRRSKTIWYATPFVVAIGLIFWTLIKAHQQEGMG